MYNPGKVRISTAFRDFCFQLQILKSNRRILVFLNMSRQEPALVSSVVVHEELLYVYSRGVSPSFFFYSADLWSKENIGMVDHDWW